MHGVINVTTLAKSMKKVKHVDLELQLVKGILHGGMKEHFWTANHMEYVSIRSQSELEFLGAYIYEG